MCTISRMSKFHPLRLDLYTQKVTYDNKITHCQKFQVPELPLGGSCWGEGIDRYCERGRERKGMAEIGRERHRDWERRSNRSSPPAG